MIVHLQSQRFLSITDFFRAMQECLIVKYGKDNINFYAAYPNESDIQNISTPIITYYFNQGLYSFGKSNNMEIKPRAGKDEFFTTAQDKKVAIQIKRQRFEYNIVFEIWETDGTRADEFAGEIKKFFSSLTGYFQGKGISEFIFRQLNGSKPEKQWKTDLVRRELIYQLVMDEITSITSPTISAFDIEGTVYKTELKLLERERAGIEEDYVLIEIPVISLST